MRKLVLAFGLLAAGCVAPPSVTEFNGDSVRIQRALGGPAPAALSIAEADRFCSKAGKRAEHASCRALPGSVTEYLFLSL